MNIGDVKSVFRFPSISRLKSGGSDKDRDPSGSGYQQQEEKQEQPNKEHFEQALEKLKSSSDASTSNLNIELIQNGEDRELIIKDPYGKVLRKISGPEVVSIANSGHILDRRI